MFGLREKIKSYLWRRELASAPWYQRYATVVLRYVFALSRDLVGGQLSLHAMSLVYSTLLATVPLIAFSFSVLKGLGLHLQMEPLLVDLMTPLGEQGKQITEEIMGMVSKVRGGVLGGLSLSIFLYTAVSMVQKVEVSFNYVWHVSQPRSIGRRVLDYATILLVGPLVMALALASVASLANNALVQALTDSSLIGPVAASFSQAVPLLLVIMLFTALYKWMPNTQVQWRAALVGGVTAGCLWGLTGYYFTTFVLYSSRALIIYAGFAIAITTLVWLYANWLLLLLGARLAFYFQNRAYLQIGREDPSLSNRTREQLALEIMRMVASAFLDRQRDITTSDIAHRVGMPGAIVGRIVRELEEARLIAATETEELIPAMDIHALKVSDILLAIRKAGDRGIPASPRWDATVQRAGEQLQQSIGDSIGEQSLADFIAGPDPEQKAETV